MAEAAHQDDSDSEVEENTELVIKDWEERQSKTFSKWVNMYLQKKGFKANVPPGRKFGNAWKNGVVLMKLMNALYDVNMPRKYKKKAKTKVHRLDNVNQALKMVTAAEVKTTHLKQVNILEGDFKMMCGMVWNIILDYNIKGISVEDKNAKTGLLLWCQKKTKDYKGVEGNINNFKKDWKNGNAFLALVDKHTNNMVNYNDMYDKSAEEKLDTAFTACETLGIPRLLEVEDLTEVDIPDDKAVMTYVSEMFKLFSKQDIKDNAREHIGRFLAFQRKMDLKIGDYKQRFDACLKWLTDKTEEYNNSEAPEDGTSCNIASDNFKEYIVNEKPSQLAEVIEILDLLSEIQGELKVNQRASYSPEEAYDPSRLQDAVITLGTAENKFMTLVRTTREGFLEAIEKDDGISQARLDEWEKAYKVFDTDHSGHLSKDEYKAALSGVGVSLEESDFEANWSSMCSEDGFIEKQQFMDYLTAFFTTSDTADSIMKSMQVLGNPDAPTDDMFVGMSDEDAAYLKSMMENSEGSLASAIASTFAASD